MEATLLAFRDNQKQMDRCLDREHLGVLRFDPFLVIVWITTIRRNIYGHFPAEQFVSLHND
jgi:hypothetical protein